MRAIWTIAQYHLLLMFKERATFFVGLLMPALMIVLLGVAMGGEMGRTIHVDVLDEDGSALSAQFLEALRAEMNAGDGLFVLCTYQGGAEDGCKLPEDIAERSAEWQALAEQRLREADAFGALVIPVGFGEALRADEPITLRLIASADLNAPTLIRQKVEAGARRFGAAVGVTNAVLDVASDAFGAEAVGERAAAFDVVRAQVDAAWQERPIRVEVRSNQGEGIPSGFNQSGPGTAIMFVLMFLLNTSTLLVVEREQGTLQRLYTLPHRRGVILGGKLLGQYLYGVLQFTVLILFGAAVGVEWGDNVLGIALIVLVFTLTATALGMALATVVRTSAQAENISLLLGLTLAPLGGAWWPLEIVPRFMRVLGHISPIAWGMDAFGELMFHGGGVVDIASPLGVLLAMAVVCFGFGVWRFRYE